MITSVIFDMDGTLLDSEGIGLEAWRIAGERMGLDFPLSLTRSFIGMNKAACMKMITERFGDRELCDRVFDLHKDIEEELYPTMLDTKPGAHEVLSALRSRGIRLALATSTHRAKACDKLGGFGLLEYFDALVGGDEVVHSKPNPDIFTEAVSRLGADVKECAVIEDSFNGVRAAHASGMYTVMVPDLIEPTPEISDLADTVVPSLFEVEGALDAAGLVHAEAVAR